MQITAYNDDNMGTLRHLEVKTGTLMTLKKLSEKYKAPSKEGERKINRYKVSTEYHRLKKIR